MFITTGTLSLASRQNSTAPTRRRVMIVTPGHILHVSVLTPQSTVSPTPDAHTVGVTGCTATRPLFWSFVLLTSVCCRGDDLPEPCDDEGDDIVIAPLLEPTAAASSPPSPAAAAAARFWLRVLKRNALCSRMAARSTGSPPVPPPPSSPLHPSPAALLAHRPFIRNKLSKEWLAPSPNNPRTFSKRWPRVGRAPSRCCRCECRCAVCSTTMASRSALRRAWTSCAFAATVVVSTAPTNHQLECDAVTLLPSKQQQQQSQSHFGTETSIWALRS